jgi:hypothetical protein
MNTALERGQAGMTDPRKEHKGRTALEHLEEFLPVMRASGKSGKDKDRKEAILQAFARKLPTLADLTHEAVDRYLAGVKGSTGNKKKHLSAVSVSTPRASGPSPPTSRGTARPATGCGRRC